MRKPKEKPGIVMRKEKGRAVPVSAFDAELWDALPDGCEINVAKRSKRSNQQLRLYWKLLSEIVAATDIAPSAVHLHDLVKEALGYMVPVRTFDGKLTFWPDSTALDEMEPDEFNAYFEKAIALLAERTGFDPMEALEAA